MTSLFCIHLPGFIFLNILSYFQIRSSWNQGHQYPCCLPLYLSPVEVSRESNTQEVLPFVITTALPGIAPEQLKSVLLVTTPNQAKGGFRNNDKRNKYIGQQLQFLSKQLALYVAVLS